MQVGSNGDDPKIAIQSEIQLEKNDIILTATDGLFDNVFIEEIHKTINKHFPLSKQKHLEILAHKLSRKAIRIGKSQNKKTPFEIEAMKHGYNFKGGKLDDTTIVISLVELEEQITDL
jgi:protein phosphatase PTC7